MQPDTDLGYSVSPRIVVIDEPEYTASYHVTDLGENRLMTFVHLDVYFLNPEILRRLDSQWALFRRCVPITLYSMADEDTPVWSKFISRFGFEFLHDIECTDGKTRRLFVNYGPNQEAQQ
jgi:hypothetical protein